MKGSCAYNILLNLWRNQDDLYVPGDALGQKKKKKKKMENSTDSRTGHFTVHLQYSKHIFS